MRIAALTDIHALGSALEQALSDARAEGYDLLLILGDLLTYGVQPAMTLDLVRDAVARDGATLLTGNHDLLYRSGPDTEDYRARLPDWLRESVEWTAGHIPAGALDQFDWCDHWAEGPLFAAHANPHAFGDWRYIRSADDADLAAEALIERGYRFGLFGHVHRARRYAGDEATIFTLASLGQPRDDADRRPQWAMVELAGDAVTVTHRPVAFDPEEHMKAIRATSLSPSTQQQLCRYFA